MAKKFEDLWLKTEMMRDRRLHHSLYEHSDVVEWVKIWRMVHLIENGFKPTLKDSKSAFDLAHPDYVFAHCCQYMEDKDRARQKFEWIMDYMRRRQCTCAHAAEMYGDGEGLKVLLDKI